MSPAPSARVYIAMGSNECAIESYAAAASVSLINVAKAPKTANDVYPGEGACTMGRGFWNTPLVGALTWGSVLMLAAAGTAGYLLYKNKKATGSWVPGYLQKL